MKVSIIPVTSYQQNCSLLICETTNKAALVDPGGDVNVLLDAIEKEEATLESIILTHGHLDHVGATAELASMFNIPVEGPHHDDQFLIEAIPSQCQVFGFPPCDSFVPTRWLKEGDVVEVGEETLEVIHCPGHTPGHIVLHHVSSKLALVGDVLFKGSIGRTDLEKGDYHTLIDSIQNKLWPLGGNISFIPGHGPMSTFAEEMEGNPFVKLAL
ncbi:MAG: MBL fold metallo-hydrolase [Methylococcaceae bacterium]|nr:MBL fold metallo-hydrolase [Methylococcaceae bacterium]